MKNKRGSLLIRLLIVALIPLLCLAILVTIFFAYTFQVSMEKEIKNGLHSLSSSLLSTYNIMYEGNYMLDNNGDLWKGSENISSDNRIIDNVKQSSDIDVTIFYRDTRMLTTIKDSNGQRATGTKAATEVTDVVLGQGKEFFSSHVSVNGTEYYGYYIPIYNSDSSIFGMMFAGKPTEQVIKVLQATIFKIIGIAVMVVAMATIVSIISSRRIAFILRRTKEHLEKIALGNLTEDIDDQLLKRNDEIGEMGKYTKQLQNSLRELVATDFLTGLYNRRTANIKLGILHNDILTGADNATFVIGDIDFFKQVNDRYGHECGDLVLKEIAKIFQAHIEGKGFIARWGGEEFLIVYEKTSIEKACEYLEKLLQIIRNMSITYYGQEVLVTMTFGATECDGSLSVAEFIKKADDNLYKGKSSGRNQIVC